METGQTELVLVFVCLALIYAVTLLFCTMRLIRIFRFSSEWMHTKIFYLFVSLQAMLRLVFFVILTVETPNRKAVSVYFLVSLPDSLFLVNYLLLVWQLFSVMHYSFEELGQEYVEGNRSKRRRLVGLMVPLAAGWSLVQSVLYLLLFLSKIETEVISIEIGVMNLSVPLFSILGIACAHLKRSGIPFKSPVWKSRLRRIICVTVWWSFTRLCRGIANLISDYSNDAISELIMTKGEGIWATGIWIVVLLVSEVFCIFIILDYGFIGIFLFTKDETSNVLLAKHEIENITEAIPEEAEVNYINEKDVQVLEHLASGKLGEMHKGIYRNMAVTYRKMKFARLSKYVIQEFSVEFQSMGRMLSEKAVKPIGIIMSIPTVGIITPYYPSSLYNLLHNQKKASSLNATVKLAADLALAIEELHFEGKVHGHLTSHNVMLTENLKPMISDLGFFKMKKYAAIMFGYTIKSGWSSPQVLMESRLIPLKVQETDDVYSFGMILWEMVVRQVPFSGISLNKVKEKVVDSNLRPRIPKMHPDLATVLMSCWNADPNKRPSIASVRETLCSMRL